MKYQDDVLQVDLPQNLTEDWFHNHMGTIQGQLRTSFVTNIEIDFSKTFWVAPLPILALILEFTRHKQINAESTLTVNLGEWGTASLSLCVARTRKFLFANGFIQCICAILKHRAIIQYLGQADSAPRQIHGDDEQKINELEREINASESEPLIHNDTVLIPATVILGSHNLSEVDRLVGAANEAYFKGSTERRAIRDSALQRLRAVLGELVKNALEHAYRDSNTVPMVGVFARSKGIAIATPVSAGRHRPPVEALHLPGEHLIESGSSAERIEVTVVDIGRGITSDSPEWKKNLASLRGIDANAAAALEKAESEEALAKLLFKFPVSRFNFRSTSDKHFDLNPARDGRSETTGLVYLNRVLGYQSDVTTLYVGALTSSKKKTASVLIFGRHPLKDGPPSHRLPLREAEQLFGTYLRVAIQLDSPTQFPKEWIIPENNPQTSAMIAARMARFDRDTSNPAIYVADRRTRVDEPIPAEAIENGGTVVVRLPRSTDKNSIRRLVHPWTRAIYTENSAEKSRLLIFSDISRAQALMIYLALTNTKLVPRWKGSLGARIQSLGSVFLVTEDFAVSVIRVFAPTTPGRDFLFEPYSIRARGAREPASNHHSEAQQRFVKIVSDLAVVLRQADSTDFWTRVIELNRADQELIVGPVKWITHDRASAVTLPVYLDLARALQERDLTRLVRKSLRRVLSLLQPFAALATDDLIDTEIKDATKWFSKPIRLDDTEHTLMGEAQIREGVVLIGSISITGGTLKKYLNEFSDSIKYVVDCFSRPISISSEVPHISALLWIEGTGISYDNALRSPSGYTYERERDSPFIRRASLSKSHTESVIKFAEPEEPGVAQRPNSMYQSFHNEGLLKIGHWKYGNRHSLIEVNTPLAVDHFITTRKGFFPWLVNTVKQYAEKPHARILIVYPMHRVAAKIVRVFTDMYNETELRTGAFDCIPLQFVPQIADGVARISDLTLSRLEYCLTKNINYEVKAIFIDIGFINKHTLRQVRRQLVTLGINVVAAAGVMNRSNSPAFQGEQNERAVKSFWRWNVPTLGRSDQCALCGAMRSIGFLQATLEASRPDLMSAVARVKESWRVAALQDSWWEAGLPPSPLKTPKRIRFGYTEDLAFDGRDSFQQRSPNEREIWHYVAQTTSTGFLSHYVELSRYTGNGALLLSKVRSSTDLTNAVITECIAGFLTITGPSLEFWLRLDYVKLLIRAMFGLEQDLLLSLQAIDSRTLSHYQRVQGLAALSVVGLDAQTKRGCCVEIASELYSYVRSAGIQGERCYVPSTELRLFLFVLSSNSHHEVRHLITQQLPHSVQISKDRDAGEKAVERAISILHSASVASLSRKELWRNALNKLGRAGTHDGEILRSLKSSMSTGNGVTASTACYTLASLLSNDDGGFLNSVGLGSNGAGSQNSCSYKGVSRFENFGSELRLLSGETLESKLEEVFGLVHEVRNLFHLNMLRCSRRGSTIAMTLKSWLTQNSILDNSDFLGSCPRFSFCSNDKQWEGTNYLPMCALMRGFIDNVLDNALRLGQGAIASPLSPAGSDERSSVWISVLPNSKEVEINVYNSVLGDFTVRNSAPDFLSEIGGRMNCNCISSSDGINLYRATIFIPWLNHL